jgi:hypothetical protein
MMPWVGHTLAKVKVAVCSPNRFGVSSEEKFL